MKDSSLVKEIMAIVISGFVTLLCQFQGGGLANILVNHKLLPLELNISLYRWVLFSNPGVGL